MTGVHLVYLLVSLTVCGMELIVLPYHKTRLCGTVQEPMLSYHEVVTIASTNGERIHVNAFWDRSNSLIRIEVSTNLDASCIEGCLHKETTCRAFLHPRTIKHSRQRELFAIEHVVTCHRKLTHVGSRGKFACM